MGLGPIVGWRIARIKQKEFVLVFCASLETFGMEWDGKKGFPHVKVCCWSTRSGGGGVCGVASVCCAVLCYAAVCRVVSVVLCCCLSVVVCWTDIVVLLVVCLLCGEKRHLTSLTVPKTHNCNRTQIAPQGIYLHYGFNLCETHLCKMKCRRNDYDVH